MKEEMLHLMSQKWKGLGLNYEPLHTDKSQITEEMGKFLETNNLKRLNPEEIKKKIWTDL